MAIECAACRIPAEAGPSLSLPSPRSQMKSVTARCANCVSRHATAGSSPGDCPSTSTVGTMTRHVTPVLSFDNSTCRSAGNCPARSVCAPTRRGGALSASCGVRSCWGTSRAPRVSRNRRPGIAGWRAWEPALTYGFRRLDPDEGHGRPPLGMPTDVNTRAGHWPRDRATWILLQLESLLANQSTEGVNSSGVIQSAAVGLQFLHGGFRAQSGPVGPVR